jgi:hypothetical protein
VVKVRMLTSVAGPDVDWPEGEIVDMTEAQAAVWADGVRAVRLDRQPAREAAVVEAPENAARRTRRAKGRR